MLSSVALSLCSEQKWGGEDIGGVGFGPTHLQRPVTFLTRSMLFCSCSLPVVWNPRCIPWLPGRSAVMSQLTLAGSESFVHREDV